MERHYFNLHRFLYHSDLRKLFLQCPSEAHEAVTKSFQRAFDSAMTGVEEASASSIRWESGSSKAILELGLDNIIKKRLCADYLIYGPLNEPYLALEVAYSQTTKKCQGESRPMAIIPICGGGDNGQCTRRPNFQVPNLHRQTAPKVEQGGLGKRNLNMSKVWTH